MSEVGALIIRLQAETAAFREDMGKVKSDLNDLKGGAQEAGEGFKYGMGEARGSLMLVEESVGVHLPRHLNSLIAQIPGVGAAFAVMLPLVGVFAAIAIIGKLIEKHRELKDEADKMRDAQSNLGGTIGTVYTGLQDKLLRAGIAADNLRGDHLGALKKELELIDHQSMQELAQQFDVLAKAAEQAFATLKAHWYQFGAGSDGAKHSLEEFQSQYELLLKTGKDTEANTLLDAKVQREEKILALQKQARDNQSVSGGKWGDYQKYEEAIIELRKLGVGITEKEIQSEQDLVDILHTQVQAHSQVKQIKSVESSNATMKDTLKGLSDEASLQKIVAAGVDAHAVAERKLAQTQAEAQSAGGKGDKTESIQDRLDAEMQAIHQEHDASVESANQILSSKRELYEYDIKAAGQNVQKKNELNAQYANEVRAHDDAIAQADAEAEKREVTALAAASAEKRRIAVASAQAEAEGVLTVAIKSAKDQEKVDTQAAKDALALHTKTVQQTIDAEVAASKAEVAAEVKGYNDRIKALDTFSADYQKKVKELQAKVTEVTNQGETQQAQIVKQGEQAKLVAIQQAENRMYESIASDVSKSIVENKNLAQSARQTGEQMLEGMIRNLIMMELTHDKEKFINAKDAFGSSYKWASAWGGPPAGAVAGAAAFAAVMSFEVGGKIPGAGAVPIMGHGGETVVTKALTDRVERAEGRGGSGGDTHYHNTFAPEIHAFDADGVDEVLAEHGERFEKKFKSQLRKRNKGNR